MEILEKINFKSVFLFILFSILQKSKILIKTYNLVFINICSQIKSFRINVDILYIP